MCPKPTFLPTERFHCFYAHPGVQARSVYIHWLETNTYTLENSTPHSPHYARQVSPARPISHLRRTRAFFFHSARKIFSTDAVRKAAFTHVVRKRAHSRTTLAFGWRTPVSSGMNRACVGRRASAPHRRRRVMNERSLAPGAAADGDDRFRFRR